MAMSTSTSRDDDRELVRRLLEGDETAFEEFADHYIPALYRFALLRLNREREPTREVVQSTVCKAIVKLASFRGEAALMTWLGSICRNEIADHFRRQSRTIQEVELTPDTIGARSRNASENVGPETDLLRRETANLVHMALDLLPPHYSRALEWKYQENLSVREIASRLDLGPKAAESVLTRARQSFRRHYDQLTQGSEMHSEWASSEKRRAVSES